MKLLSILIPTYNRSENIQKNIKSLTEYIIKNKYEKDINIIISNNCSTDDTGSILEEFKNKHKMIEVHHQISNIGLEKNVLFVLNESTSEYVMFLGDDDYLEEEYLIKVVEKIKKEKDIATIIPNFICILPTGEVIEGSERDKKIPSKEYAKGFNNCLENSWRGHQLSGLVLKRKNLLESYKENKVSNIYPFIYFVAYSCFVGKTWHFTEYPIKVTQPGQKNKDWTYKEDGLISEIFDNYKKLDKITSYERMLLEMKILKEQSWRYMMYGKKTIKVIYKIEKHQNTSMRTKILFPCFLTTIFPYFLSTILIKKCVNKFRRTR